jgi:alanine racemase
VKSWIEVSEERLQQNYGVLSERAGAGTTVMAVVKANAYGHGGERCAVALARAGAVWFGVADVREGAAVRCALNAAGFVRTEVLVLCGLLPENVAPLVQNRLTPVVWTPDQVSALAGHPGLKVHVELETGMGRQGCRPGVELDAVLDAIEASGLVLGGLMTHFCAAEVVGSAKTREQMADFERGIEQVRARGMRPEWVHAGASSSLDNPLWRPEWLAGLAASAGAKPMVRCGIGLYGYCNPLDAGEPVVRPRLRPVMTWKTRVIDVREAGPGDCIGYNSTFTVPAPMRLALLPVGYADGMRRSLSSTNTREGGWVMIHSRRAPVVGRVSMNLTMIDVSGIEGVAVGDEVILLGDGITADDHARLAGTISYEILCGVRAEPISFP